MSWQQLTLFTQNKDAVEAISELLESAGALSITYQDAADEEIFEPEIGSTPLWHATKITALFSADTDMSAVETLLDNFSQLEKPAKYTIEVLEEREWSKLWMKDFKPLQFADNLWICPSWCEPVDPAAVNIKLDPGLAFGTGTHPTTALCLQWLAKQTLNNELVIDFGCGSGILGIAALLLGAKQVYAVDIDPQAVLATKDNAKQNGIVEPQIITTLTDQIDLPKADILLANILANPLIELAEQFSHLVKDNGYIVLSGIIESQRDVIVNHYQQWFTISEITSQENWFCIVAKKMKNTLEQ